MSKFKIGDKVYLKKTSAWFGDGTHNPDSEDIIGEVIDITLSGYQVNWIGRYVNSAYTDDCLEFADKGETMNPKDLYRHTHDGVVLCGSTVVEQAKRRKDGEAQFIIRYEGSSVKNGAVKRSDIPALVAALLDVYDRDLKEKELPF